MIKIFFIGTPNFSLGELPKDTEVVSKLILSDQANGSKSFNYSELRRELSQKEINAFFLQEEIVQKFPEIVDKLGLTGLPVFTSLGAIELVKGGNARIIKRLIDILLSMVGLLFTGLVAIVIYPIIQKQSPGNIVFTQDRVGKNGKHFKIYKFRSMYLDAEQRKQELLKQNEINSDLMFKLENDPRIFPFGQYLRNWSIDELPQFLNVLKGDMSIVGTRPPTVEEVSKYELHHFKRLAMQPGITGMWQVSGRSNIQDFEEVVKLDVSYIDNFSLWLDLKIILKTVKVVLLKEGSK